jgi:putative transposase
VAAGLPHRVTIRGVDRCGSFSSARDEDVRVLAWCLMSNHVHWIVVPEEKNSLEVLFRRVNGRYAQYFNARRCRTGHLWERRFFSCMLEDSHLWTALRYVERNPVRAGMAAEPWTYRWSSCAEHLALPEARRAVLLDPAPWLSLRGAEGWKELISVEEPIPRYTALRRATYAGSPFGSEAFIEEMGRRFQCQWRPIGRRSRKPPQIHSGGEALCLFRAI